MLEEEGDDYWFAGCDRCIHSEEVLAASFQEAIETLKNDKWKIRKDDSEEWEHVCPKCVAKEKDFSTFKRKMRERHV